MPRCTNRTGRVNSLWTLLFCAGVAIAGLIALMAVGGPGHATEDDKLFMYCAAGLRYGAEEVAQMYQDEYGVEVELQYAGSNTLLNQIQVNKFDTGDLYLAADDFYTDLAREKGLAAETLPIAHMRPVIAVRKDAKKQIKSIEDMLRDDVVVVIAGPDDAAVGRAVRDRLQQVTDGDSNLWERLEKHVTDNGVFKPTVNEVANDIKIGHADVGIVWDSTVAMPKYRDNLVAIPSDYLEGEPSLVSICVLNSSRRPASALKFARYLTARDRGLPAFEKCGVRPVEGDVWSERPSINFYCGAVNRRAVEQIVADFQMREACEVNTIYDGCGILTSRMNAIDDQRTALGFPDVYMACDVYYLDKVKGWFQEAANVSETEIVIAVPKGSNKVTSPADLLKPGVRVAVGEPDQCTIGVLTQRLLGSELYDKLMEKQQQDGEVVVQKSSSALIVPDVVTGHVDAGIAYITDTMANRKDVDIVRIDSPLNVAIQPFSIAKTSDHKYLVRRLFQRVASSPAAFESAGFRFRLAGSTAEESSKNRP